MSATPDEIAAYYADYPQPPARPPQGALAEERAAYMQALQAYEAQCGAYEQEQGPPPSPAEVNLPPALGGGRPAARMGDMTAHGGVISTGCSTVLIGGQPAARVTDMQACPMVSGVVPHVGGAIVPPGGVTVVIGGYPAARMGDQGACPGGPSVLAGGDFKVLIG